MSERQITVKGTGKATARPDQIVLTMNLEVTKVDYENAMEQGALLLEGLRAAVVAAGHDVKDLKTTNFSINAKYESVQKEGAWIQQFVGYTSVHGLRLEFDLDMAKLGATIAAVARCEAEPTMDIRFTVKDPSAISETLLLSAISDAQLKATILAAAAGVKLGAIQRIDYTWSELRVQSPTALDMGNRARGAVATSAAKLDFEPEDIQANDTATVVWSIE